MIKVHNRIIVHQEYIFQLLEQLTIGYQNTKLERQQISARDFLISAEDFTPLEELELLTVNIRGYACQIEATGTVKNAKQVIAELQKLSVFNNHLIVKLNSEARSQYPQIHSYIYVRLPEIIGIGIFPDSSKLTGNFCLKVNDILKQIVIARQSYF